MTLLQMTGMYQTIANDGCGFRRGSSRRPSRRTARAPKSHARKVFGWFRRRRRKPYATCCALWCNVTRWATSRAPGGGRGRWLSDLRQNRYRPADQPCVRLLFR
ncbi:peptidoglycan synthase FtsI domain protein [Mycobacterium xenopi 4042]|uniref:Peptidoglycan synthase FtsI domain protein n=1 Tax=Mycobacterium xenopi 4042 TaxID=1299334 RepID=X7ZZ17_MYCXE|nr:peptidoglycan synthase FtsI domain protein [Mycobacterium xenopi 4042]